MKQINRNHNYFCLSAIKPLPVPHSVMWTVMITLYGPIIFIGISGLFDHLLQHNVFIRHPRSIGLTHGDGTHVDTRGLSRLGGYTLHDTKKVIIIVFLRPSV